MYLMNQTTSKVENNKTDAITVRRHILAEEMPAVACCIFSP